MVCIQEPVLETRAASHSMRKSTRRNGAHGPALALAPDEGVPGFMTVLADFRP
jgi:hypothetical protein